MRKLSMVLALAIVAIQAFSANITVSPKISDVTVYLQGATIESSVSTNIPSGVSYVTLSDLPTMVNEESIQVSGFGDFTIMNVSFQLSNAQTHKVDSLTKLQLELIDRATNLSNEKDVYNQSITMLDANKEIKGTTSNLNTVELDKFLKYYQTELLKLKTKIFETDKELAIVKNTLAQVNSELSVYKRAQKKGEVVVAVSSKKEQKIRLELAYFIYAASWTPYYEVRVADVDKDLEVTYKAKVYQTSGYDWNNVNVTLSTGNPTLNGTVPTLTKWVLRDNVYSSRVKTYKANMAVAVADEDFAEIEDAVEMPVKKASSIKTTTNTQMTSIEFAIQEKFSVKSSQNDATVSINQNSLPASYVYRCVPKLDKHAYLLAKATDFAQYNFLSGDATLYLAGKYVGTSYLNISQTTDTLQFSLGQDNGIVVDRTLSDEYNKKASVGKNFKQTVEWTIRVKNNKQKSVNIEIQDNIPVSNMSSVTVSNQSYEGATINDLNIVEWKFELKPAELKTLKLGYQVIYPKTVSLNLK
ncbi:MAG: DUF4139 domain-containing protein [Bacteroidales bacterium]|nr:DUF4139 domain-containing protein [Bacteroidales bacterium]